MNNSFDPKSYLGIYLEERGYDWEHYMLPLHMLVEKLQPTCGLEFGVDGGLSTYSYLTACNSPLLSVDIRNIPSDTGEDFPGNALIIDHCTQSRNLVRQLLINYREQWTFLCGNSVNVIQTLAQDSFKYDYCYLDTSHIFDSTVAELFLLHRSNILANNAVLVLDDYADRKRFGVGRATDQFLLKYPEWNIFNFEDVCLPSHNTGAVILARFDLPALLLSN